MEEITSSGGPSGVPPEPLMPLSMPRVLNDPGVVTDAAEPADPPTLEHQPTLEFPSLMPLSMPTTGSFGGTPPPPPPPPPFGSGGWSSFAPPEGPPPQRHSSRRRMTAVVVSVAVLAAAVGAGLGAALTNTNSSNPNAISPPTTAPSPTLPGTKPSALVTSVSAAVLPAVVDIQTKVATESGTTTDQEAGTGMILTSSGVVLTNNHVIDDATSIKVTIQGHPGTYNATVLGVDPPQSSDVALLQIQGVSNLPHVRLANSSQVKVGEPVVAIGNALGLEGTPSVVSGIVSALGRTINASDGNGTASETLHNMIQTDAPIVPGDSGGPLVNASGQVIGMDTAALSTQQSSATIGFAIPINTAGNIATNIEHKKATNGIILGESAFLGVFEEPATGAGNSGFNFGIGNSGNPNSGNSGTTTAGVVIAGVAANSPASVAGLSAGDVVTSLAGKQVTTWSQLTSVVSGFHPGSSVAISFVDSGGVPHTGTVVLAGIPK